MSNERRIIRASEIGEYNYCSRAWWYRHVIRLAPPDGGQQSGRFIQGKEAHTQHGRSVAISSMLRAIGVGLLLLGALLLALTLLLNTAGG